MSSNVAYVHRAPISCSAPPFPMRWAVYDYSYRGGNARLGYHQIWSKSLWRRAIKKDHTGSIRPRRYNIGKAISIEIGNGQPVNRAIAIAERDVAVMASCAVIEVDHTGSCGFSDDDIGCA